MVLIGAVPGWISTWLTTLWLLGVGALLGLAILVVMWLVLFLVARRGAVAVPRLIGEGPMMPIFVATAALAVFGIVGAFIAAERNELIASMLRLPFVGTTTYQVVVPAAPDESTEPEVVEIAAVFRGNELRSVTFNSDGDIVVATPQNEEGESAVIWEVAANEVNQWELSIRAAAQLEDVLVENLIATNMGDRDATLSIDLTTAAAHPQVSLVAVTTVSVVGIFLLFLLQQWWLPKTSAIAFSTAKSEMAQPLFLIFMVGGWFLIGLFMFIPYNTFGEDIKMLKDSGLTLIMVFAIFQAVWGASNSVSAEIEGRTAMTVLSKPIGRRQFVIGKFLGISWTSAVMFILLGLWLLIIVAYKPIYDARETANTAPTWQVCHAEMVRTVPGLVLAFFEALVFAAIGVAISTRLPLLANLVICFSIYAFGHLTPLLVQSGEMQFENVRFMAQFIATVLPVLDHFNIQAAVAAGLEVPLSYLATAGLYCLLYCTIAMLLALVFFEDRDLA